MVSWVCMPNTSLHLLWFKGFDAQTHRLTRNRRLKFHSNGIKVLRSSILSSRIWFCEKKHSDWHSLTSLSGMKRKRVEECSDGNNRKRELNIKANSGSWTNEWHRLKWEGVLRAQSLPRQVAWMWLYIKIRRLITVGPPPLTRFIIVLKYLAFSGGQVNSIWQRCINLTLDGRNTTLLNKCK